jgi:Kef-type K+ transport system membrane component KefB
VTFDLTSLLIVAAAAFGAPLALGLVPALRLPSVVLEIALGIVLGPAVLGWAHADDAVQLMSLLGLAFLLLLAGLEIDFERLGGKVGAVAGAGFLPSFAIALVLAYGLDVSGLVHAPLLIAIIASATSLGVVIAVLKDAGELSSPFGQLVLAGASIADVATIILLSLFFSEKSSGLGAKVVLLVAFAALVAAIGVAIVGAEHSRRLSQALQRLQDTTAQIRVRAAFVLLVGFVVLAQRFGLEAILGAFMAGAVLKLVDRDRMMTHPQFRTKLEGAGFGVFIPFFFVTSGLKFDLHALFASGSTLALVPIFVILLLLVRGVPALLYRPFLDAPRIVAAGLLQATTLGFIVVASQIGMDLGILAKGTGAAFIAAGLVSVLVFPLASVTLLSRGDRRMKMEAQPAMTL